ncbi:MAG: hypothetical protein KBB26_00480 [Candidatus Omnitrophica bacterium]|nr:hypothetical protein [Candidatus Omnitrophota bacterium]
MNGTNASGASINANTIHFKGTFEMDPDSVGSMNNIVLSGCCGATTALPWDMTLDSLTINGNILTGSGDIVVNGPLAWSAGTMSGDGKTTANGGILITGGGEKYLYRKLDNANNQVAVYGVEGQEVRYWRIYGEFNNLAGSELKVITGWAIEGNGIFNNAGRITSSSSITINPEFKNSGTVDVLNKSFVANGGYTQTAGVTQLSGGTLTSSSIINILGGELVGSGTIGNSVENGGTIIPGGAHSIGSLTINGSLTMLDTSELRLEITRGDVSTPVIKDFIKVNGNTTFAGDLLVQILNPDITSYINPTDFFTMLQANTTIGGVFANAFNGTKISTLDGEHSFFIHYGAESDFAGNTNELIFSSFDQEEGLLPPDLTLISADISFNPVNPLINEGGYNDAFTIYAKIHNYGQTDAENFVVKFFDRPEGDPVLLGETTVPIIKEGESTIASILVPVDTFPQSYRLIQVEVDTGNDVVEIAENNNIASLVLQIGNPDPSSAEIMVQAFGASICQGGTVRITGRADYDFDTIAGEPDFPVQGGIVKVRVKNNNGDLLGEFLGSNTAVNGSFSQAVRAPEEDGDYPIEVEVTDGTKTKFITDGLYLTVSGTCSTGGGSGGSIPGPTTPPPPPVPDVMIYSSDIQFSNTNPDIGETIDIHAFVHYSGNDPVNENIPVTFNDLFPVNGELQTFTIGSSVIKFPLGEASSPAEIILSWRNSAYGSHIMQVVTEPPEFDVRPSNDKATRAIDIGIEEATLSLSKTSVLLNDTDGDGQVSYGDVLEYTLTYKNNGETEVTNARLIDDYDELILTLPVTLPGAVIENGKVTWDLGTLAAGAEGSKTYTATINPFLGKEYINNIALLTATGAKTVFAYKEVEAYGNTPPMADAGENLTIVSSQQPNVVVLGTASDTDGDPLEYRWLEGSTVLQDWAAVGVAGEAFLTLALVDYLATGAHELVLEVNDGLIIVSDEMVLTVDNAPPTVAPSGGGTYHLGDSIHLLGEVSDFDGDTLTYRWYRLESGVQELFYEGIIPTIQGGESVSLDDFVLAVDVLPTGTHEIYLEAEDGYNPAVSASIEVIVIGDLEPPTISATADPGILWPPNHKLVPVVINFEVQDNSEGPITITATVLSSEPPDLDDEGNVIPDFSEPVIDVAAGTISLNLRAERQGSGDGRVYTITITATDEFDNSSQAIVNVVCPHDRGRN